MDDLAREEEPSVRNRFFGFVGVLDGPVDAVAEAKLAGQTDGQPEGLGRVTEFADPRDDVARVVLIEEGRDLGLKAQAFLEIGLHCGEVIKAARPAVI